MKKHSPGFVLPAVLVLAAMLASLMVFQVALQIHAVASWKAYEQRVKSFYMAEAGFATWQWDLQNSNLPAQRFDITDRNLPIYLKDAYINQVYQVRTPYGSFLYYAGTANQVLALGSPDQKITANSSKQLLYFDGERLSQ